MSDLDELTSKPISTDRPYISDPFSTGEVMPVEHIDLAFEDDTMPEPARSFLSSQGLDPASFTLRSVWQDGNGELRFSFRGKTTQEATGASLTDAELDRVLSAQPDVIVAQEPGEGPQRTALVLLGDMQVGKADGDGTAGILRRLYAALDAAHTELERRILMEGDLEQVVVAWLGDHIEGFVSQGGANAWRTELPLTEQVRIIRRAMLYTMEKFTTLGLPLKMVAVPGNHGEAVRFQGGGVTRYDDSWDTETLIALADAAEMSEAYKHVKFYVPDSDELSVGLDCSGTFVTFAHGHMAKTQHKLMEWVKGQAFNRGSIYAGADLSVFGHFHSFFVETSSDRTVMTVPALEAESTWYRHRTGVTGDPGIVVAYTGDGRTGDMRLIR